MSRIEYRIINWIIQKRNIFFFIVITLLGVGVRYAGKDFISGDMKVYLIPWYVYLADRGFPALSQQVGDYNLLYQTLIMIMAGFGINCVYMYKILSGIFDFALAFMVSVFVSDLKKEKYFDFLFNLIYATVLFLPIVILNSAYWGQCDAIYTTFVIIMLWFLYKEKYFRAFIALGIAISFKLQAIFILPFVIVYYFYKKKFSIFLFGVPVAVLWLSGIVTYVYGRELLAPFKIYISQTLSYPRMWLNESSFWMLVGDDYESLHVYAILFTIALCGIGLYFVISDKKHMDTPERFLNVCAWFLWVCMLFLPAMHDRYTFMLDIVLVMLGFIDKKYIKYASLSVVLSTITYGYFLFLGEDIISVWQAVAFFFAWLLYTYEILKEEKREIKEIENVIIS